MYEMAKSAREKMKAKAKALAGERDQKVDSSDWTPAEPINAEAKTGMRPLSRRAYKSGGKVSSEIGVGMANKNMKEANEKREGVKHIGGLKHGGKAKYSNGGVSPDSDANKKDKKLTSSELYEKAKMGRNDPKWTPNLLDQMSKKHGGKIKRATGGNVPSAAETEDNKERLGSMKIKPVRGAAEHYKKGGKIKKAGGGSFLERMVGKPKTGSDMSQVGKSGTARYTQEDKGALNRAIRGDDALPEPNEAAERSGKYQNYKRGGKASHPDVVEDRALVKKMVKSSALTGKKIGGRLGKAGGGALEMGGESKPKHRKDSKITDIKINILAGGQRPPMGDLAGGLPGAAGAPPPAMPPMGAPPVAGPPPAMPPMGGMPGAPVPGIPGRKDGGRISKVAKTYKDMTAGSGSGEGRLQKTDIAKRHADAPARKAGGKVDFKSIKGGAKGKTMLAGVKVRGK